MIKPGILLKKKLKLSDIEFIPEASNRKVDPELEKSVDAIWRELEIDAEKNGKLAYDNPYTYRLNEFEFKDGKLYIHAGQIDFKTRFSIRKNPKMYELSEEYWSKGLFIGSLIKTLDNKYVFGVRSDKTLANKKEDLIGGSLDKMYYENYLKGMLVEEFQEELSISEGNIDSIIAIGLVISRTTFTGIVCLTKINLSSFELNKIFERSNDHLEMKSLRFIEEHELKHYLVELGDYRELIPELLDL